MSTLSAAALNKENAVAPRAQSGKTSTTTAPTAAARTFGANLTNQEKNAAKTALKGAALQPAKTPLGVSKRPSAVLDDVPAVEHMPKAAAYKYEPQLDLDVDVKKPRARLPTGAGFGAKKAAAASKKALEAPMSMDEFAFADDLYGADRSAAAVKALADKAPTALLFDVPDDLFKADN